MPALDGELHAIGRKSELRDFLRGEMRELAVRRAVQRLQPKIVHTFFAHVVNNVLAVRRKPEGPGSSLVNVVIPGFLVRRGHEFHHQLVVGLAHLQRNVNLAVR